MPFGVSSSIRELGVNKLLPKNNRLSGNDRLKMESNLMLIKIMYLKFFAPVYHSNKLNLSLINVQSIKPKENIILDFLLSNEIDLTLTTETYLLKSDDNQAWVNSSTLNTGEYRIQVIKRPDRREGGLAQIDKAIVKTKLLNSGQTRSFEY